MKQEIQKVLIVDDNPVNVDVLKRALEKQGCEISMAPSGEMALNLVPKIEPNLILLDVMMPGLDGFDTCLQLKQMEVMRDVPIIFVTGKASTEDIVRGFEVGGVDYVSKPFRHEEVLARVTTHLKLQTANRQNRRLIGDLKNALVKMEDAQQESLAKTQFLSRMSHELRSPMTLIQGFVQLLQINQKGNLDEDDLKKLETVRQAANHLMKLIERVLDYSVLDSEKLTLEARPVLLSPLIRESIDYHQELARKNQVDVEVNLNGTDNKKVQADPAKLREIIDILMDNAIKYNDPEGKVKVEGHMSPSGNVVLAIMDTGWGVPAADADRIFQPLYRVRERVEEVDGIGMGLAYARKYADLMHANVSFEPGPEGGSRFLLELLPGDS